MKTATKKNLGIWMDHSSAELIDLEAKKNSQTITTQFTFNTQEEALKKSENLMHNKEQQMDLSYYKEIGEEILKYDHVLLFGPTNAKKELYNFLEKDSHYKDIQIDVEPADKMTDNEKDAFVRDHFDQKA